MYERVLVGTDGSATADRAVEVAALTARAHAAELTIAYALRASRADEAWLDPNVPNELRWRLTPGAIAESTVETAVGRARRVAGPGLVVHGRFEPGRPVPVLLRLIDELDTDAIVVGNRDLRGRLPLRHGVGHVLSRKAPCDVIIADTAPRRTGRHAGSRIRPVVAPELG